MVACGLLRVTPVGDGKVGKIIFKSPPVALGQRGKNKRLKQNNEYGKACRLSRCCPGRRAKLKPYDEYGGRCARGA